MLQLECPKCSQLLPDHVVDLCKDAVVFWHGAEFGALVS